MLPYPELDRMILSNLEDKDLINYCRTNKAMNKICNDQTFWFNRLVSRFPQIDLKVMAKVKEGSWSDVYIQMVQFVRSVSQADWLSKKGKEVVISFQDKNRALRWASRYGYLGIVKYLVENGANIHAENDHALLWASANGQLEVVKYLVNNGANIHADNDFALRWASKYGHLEVVKFLVQNGADIHDEDDEALRWTSFYGYLEIVKFLVQNGADIHAEDDWALRMATKYGHLEVVNYLKSLM